MAHPRATAAGQDVMHPAPTVTPEIAAEAAVWVARLHGPDRSRDLERECLAWQQRSGAHREAFERCTDTWEGVPRVSLASAFSARSAQVPVADGRPWRFRSARWATAGALVFTAVALTIGYRHWYERGLYSTGVGEQQLVVLDDGSRLTLNTDTRVRVDLKSEQRLVRVAGGEVVFEVAKDPARPFVVHVGGSEVVALGTVFSVRFTARGARPPETVSVTLIEGKVAVRAAAGEGTGPAPSGVVQMLAGDRVQVRRSDVAEKVGPVAAVDRPNVDHLLAWRRNEAVFDDASIADAVAEMNRYSRTPIALLDGLDASSYRISGLYRTGDAAGFASAVAALHGLRLRQIDGRLELSKPQ